MQKITENNSLINRYPEIATEWDCDKNKDISLEKATIGSFKKVWWKCNIGHSWYMSINTRIKSKNGCPYCAASKVLEGFNDLLTTYPEVAKEWNYDKNDLLPTDVTYRSSKKIWWKCKKKHEWLAVVSNRTLRRSNCPYCFNAQQTSFGEQAIYFYLKKDLNHEVLNRHKITVANNKKIEVDIYIPRLNIGIEFDGIYWHKDKKDEDAVKTKLLNDNGIKLFRVIEDKTNYIDNNNIHFDCYKDEYRNLSIAISVLEDMLNIKHMKIDAAADSVSILDMLSFNELNNSLEIRFPEIAKEWNYEKNKGLKPSYFAWSAGKIVWWKCSKNHEYKTSIANRTYRGSGCPYCSGHKVLKGFNDLYTMFPEIAKEWNKEKNINIYPWQYTYGSNKRVWWKCVEEHEWEESIGTRTNMKTGCPYCSGHRIIEGYNDLQTKFPDVAKEWHPNKNKNLRPNSISPGSMKKVWWKCSYGHEWKAVIQNRTYSNYGCPFCKGKRLIDGSNDLLFLNPDLSKQWNYDKNDKSPKDYFSSSHAKVWWKCKLGHEWEATINSRATSKLGCPYCSNRKILKGYNDLTITAPELVNEWNYEKNGIETPDNFVSGSKRKIWWKCNKGHEWEAIIKDRFNGHGCPYCYDERRGSGNIRKCILYVDGVEFKEFDSQFDCGQYLFGTKKKITQYTVKERKVRKGRLAGHIIFVKNKE